MIDQASALREQAQRQYRTTPVGWTSNCQLLAITSGKGGVGKTHVVVNLAIALRAAGKRVAIFDADFGLANVDVFLGLNPKYHLGHVIEGVRTLRSVIVHSPEGVDIIPASSGIQELTMMGEAKRRELLSQLVAVSRNYDYILIDTAAGIADNVIRFLMAARRVIVVSAPEPTAIVDAYALIKVLIRRDKEKELFLLVNSAQDMEEARGVHQQLARVVSRFLGHSLIYLGAIPKDKKVCESVRLQTPLLVSHPRSYISRCFRQIAEDLIRRPTLPNQFDGFLQGTV